MNYLTAKLNRFLTGEFAKFLGILILCALAYYVFKKTLVRYAHRLARRSQNKIDDLLSEYKVFDIVALLVPIVILHHLSGFVPSFSAFIDKIVSIIWTVIFTLIISKALSIALYIYEQKPISKRWPLKGYVQIIKFVIYLGSAIVVVCILLDRSPWKLLSGLGAISAVLMIVFRHTLVSFVANFQIVSQDLIRIGDWIEMPKFNVDGEVVDITLHTVSVQNWDKTIVTVPTYKFLEESFKNWRGMQLAGGRRIKRAIYIDKTSVKFCDEKMIEKFKRIQIIREYVEMKQKEIEEYNRRHGIDTKSSKINGRKMTNLGTFRVYIEEYLKRHPLIRKDMTLMVRQLQPTSEGIPLEIYCFVADTRWIPYEKVQADIFDHIFASVGEFELKLFQKPTGDDLKEAVKEFLNEATGRRGVFPEN